MWLMQSMTLLLGPHLGTSYMILFRPKPPLLSALSDFLAGPLNMQPMSLLILPIGLILIRFGMGSPLLLQNPLYKQTCCNNFCTCRFSLVLAFFVIYFSVAIQILFLFKKKITKPFRLNFFHFFQSHNIYIYIYIYIYILVTK